MHRDLRRFGSLDHSARAVQGGLAQGSCAGFRWRLRTEGHVDTPALEARRALVLLDRPLVVSLIELTLNHGLFIVRAV